MLKYFLRCNFILKVLLLTFLFVLYNSFLPGANYYALGFSLLLIFTSPYKYIKYIDNSWRLIFLFYFMFGTIPLLEYEDYTYKYLLASLIPATFYIFGKRVASGVDYCLLFKFTAIILFVFSLNSVVVCILEIVDTGNLINYTRILSRYVNDDQMIMPATQFGINVSLGLIGLGIFIISNQKKIVQYLYLLIFLSSLIVSVNLINRSGIIISLICTFFIVYSGYNSKNKIKIISSILLLFILCFIVIKSKIFETNIFDAYIYREESEQNSGLFNAGSRSWRWLEAIPKIFQYPFGYKDLIPRDFFIHNIWLDVSCIAGILPFILLIIITYKMLITSYKLYKTNFCNFTIVMLGLNVSFLLTFFMEPILVGSAIYFYLYCFFYGIVNQLYKQYTNNLS